MTAFNKQFKKPVNRRFVANFYNTDGYEPITLVKETYDFTDNIIVGETHGDSINSSQAARKIPYRVSWVPKKYPLKAPKEPVLYVPARPTFKERRKDQTEASYRGAYRRYLSVFKAWHKASARNVSKYNIRFQKYEKRLAKYRQLLALAKNGLLRYRRARSRASEWHPYHVVRTYTLPFYGLLKRVYPIYHPRIFVGGILWASARYELFTEGDGTYFSQDEGYIPGFYPSAFPLPAAPNANHVEVFQLLELSTSRASKQFYDRLSDQEVHIANIVAERHQTFSMLRDLLKRVHDLLSKRDKLSLTQLVGGETKGIGKKVSNDFLMFQFGLRPLMSDIFGAIEVITAMSVGSPPTFTVRSQGKAVGAYELDGNHYRVDCKTRFVVDYSVDNEYLAVLNSIGLVNPLEPAWEVLPWSFVVDWFIPIGNWIHALNNCTGFVFLRGTKATTRLVTQTTAFAGKSAIEQYGRRYWNGHIQQVEERKERILLDAPPALELPRFKNPLSPYHIAETIALIAQRFR